MDSSATLNSKHHHNRGQILPKQCDHNILFPAKNNHHHSSRRTPSFSSSSSSSFSSSSFSCFPEDSSPLSPATPLRFSGVPFSWEKLPGIPKKNNNNVHKKKETSLLKQQLPLPPTLTSPTLKKLHPDEIIGMSKKFSTESFGKDHDPFVAALVQCSKAVDNDDDDDHDDHDHEGYSRTSNNKYFWLNSAKISRSISDRFGFVSLYTSCKRTCAVSESIVYLPRSSRTSYGLITRRSH